MASSVFRSHDLRHISGRVLAVGDVHGRFDLLEARLSQMSYDPSCDRIVLLGDLVNRGPYSRQVDRWWDELRVIGNHEQMVAWSAYGLSDRQQTKSYGSWFSGVPAEDRRDFADRLMDAPVALEIITPAGRTVGFVHAQVPSLPRHDWKRLAEMMKDPQDPFHRQALGHASAMVYDWAVARDILSSVDHPDHDNAREQAIWARSQSILIKMHREAPWVDGIDHVFFGHARFPVPMSFRNCSWIDTGAYETGNITVVDVDRWVAEKEGQEAGALP